MNIQIRIRYFLFQHEIGDFFYPRNAVVSFDDIPFQVYSAPEKVGMGDEIERIPHRPLWQFYGKT